MGKGPEHLIRDARRGKETAFLRLSDEHRLQLFRFAWRLTGSIADAEDIVQECFLALLRPNCGFDPENLLEGLEAWQATSIVAQIRQSEPKVYVDGQLVAPLKYGPAASIDVQVPGDGVYSIIPYPIRRHRASGEPTGWVEAGHLHGSVIEFQAGGKPVRIECNKPIVDTDRPVFAMHRP
jgi:hypothetical protein